MRKSFGDLDYIPESIGLLVGIGDGIITEKTTRAHARSYYRAAIAGTGLLGDHFGHWHPDVTIGMMTAAATLAAQSVPTAIHNKTISGEGGLFPYQVTGLSHNDPRRQQPTQAGYHKRFEVTGLSNQTPRRQMPTQAGFEVTGLSHRDPRRQLPTAAGFSQGYPNSRASGRPATQNPTIAG